MRLANTALPAPSVWLGYGVLLSALSWALFRSLLDLPHDLDDVPALRDNTMVAGDPWVLLRGFYHPSGRPVGHLVRWMLFLISGNDLRAFHGLSILTHTANAFLVAFLGYRLGLGARASLAAGVLFLVHVAHFKAIHHVAALEYLLATFFSICALIALAEYIARPGLPRLAAVYALVVAGIASHIAASAILPVGALFVWSRAANDKRVWRSFFPLLLLAVLLLYLLLARVSSQAIPTTTGRAFDYLSGGNVPSMVFSSGKMLAWLTAQLFALSHVLVGHLWEVYSWQLLCGVLVWLVSFWQFRRDPGSTPSLFLAWSLAFLIPFVLQDEQTIRDVPGPSRYLYLASVGSALVTAQLLAALSSAGNQWYRAGALVLALTALISSWLALTKLEALSYYTASLRYRSEGNMESSRDFAEIALAKGRGVLPLEDAYTALLLPQTRLDSDQARRKAQELLLQDPGSPTLSLFHAVFASQSASADWPDQEARLRAMARDRLVSAIFTNWARHQLKSDAAAALGSLRRAVDFDPENSEALYFYGALLTDTGDLNGLRYYVRAVDLDRQFGRFRALLDGLAKRHRLVEAIAFVGQLDQTPATRRFVELARGMPD